MKSLLLSLLTLLALLLPSACQSEEATEPFVELSKTLIEATADSATHSLRVVTNQDHWSTLQAEPVSWLRLTSEGDQLHITLAPNTADEARQTTLLVRAAEALQRLTIRQAGTRSSVLIDTTALTLSSLGETRVLNFGLKAAAAKLELLDEDAASWLSLDKMGGGRFQLHAQPQEESSSQPRATKLMLTLGTQTYEIRVRQEGQRYYMLPLLRNPLSAPNLFALEEARGSHTIRTIGGNNLSYFQFAANARIGAAGFIEYNYAFIDDEGYTKASVVYKGRDRFESDGALHPDFLAYMQSEGFTQIQKDDLSDLMQVRIPADAFAYFAKLVDNTRFVAYLTRINSQSDIRLEVRHELASLAPVAGQTFRKMPLIEQANWIGSRAYNKRALRKKADILTYEADLGSQLDTEQSGPLSGYTGAHYSYFKVKPTADNPETGRGYITLLPGKYWISGIDLTLPEGDAYIDDVEGVLASYDDIGYIYTQQAGEYLVTAEAKKLFAAHGFPYARRMTNGADLFLNATTRLAYIVDRPVVDGQRRLRIRVQYFGS